MQALAAGVARPSTTSLPTFELGSRQQHGAAETRPAAASSRASDSSSSQDEAPRAGPGQEQHSPAGVDTSTLPIVTPSRIRIDSKVLACHTTSQWLTNAIFAALILLKLDGTLTRTSWWVIFGPAWLSHVLHISLQIVVLLATESMILRQIGPPPPLTATSGLHLQYSMVLRTRSRSHIIDNVNSIIDSAAMFIVKCLFCWLLEAGLLGTVSLRTIFSPFWVAWGVTTLLGCLKDQSEQVIGSFRDLLYVFMLMVAIQVDDGAVDSWRTTFIIPWIWFAVLFLIAWVVFTLLLFARVWARLGELLLPVSFFLLLASTAPQFLSYVNLVKTLDGDQQLDLNSILIPNAVSWGCMWLSSLLLAWGLYKKEVVRDALLASGAVWTMHEAMARRMRFQDQEAIRARVDRMSEAEVAKLVEEMMAGKTKPLRLERVGATLYRRFQPDAMLGVEVAGGPTELAGVVGDAGRGVRTTTPGVAPGDDDPATRVSPQYARRPGGTGGTLSAGELGLARAASGPVAGSEAVPGAAPGPGAGPGVGAGAGARLASSASLGAGGLSPRTHGPAGAVNRHTAATSGNGGTGERGGSRGGAISPPGLVEDEDEDVGLGAAGGRGAAPSLGSGAEGDASARPVGGPGRSSAALLGSLEDDGDGGDVVHGPAAAALGLNGSRGAGAGGTSGRGLTVAEEQVGEEEEGQGDSATQGARSSGPGTDRQSRGNGQRAGSGRLSGTPPVAAFAVDGPNVQGKPGAAGVGGVGGAGGGRGVGGVGGVSFSGTASAAWTAVDTASPSGSSRAAGRDAAGTNAGSGASRPRPHSALPPQLSGWSSGRGGAGGEAGRAGRGDVRRGSGNAARDAGLERVRRVSSRLAGDPNGDGRTAVPSGSGGMAGLLGLVRSVDASLGIMSPSTAPGPSASSRVAPEPPPAAAAGGGTSEPSPSLEAAGATGAGAGAGAGATSVPIDAADDTCIICYDGTATCVFLDCGHGGFCQRCAYLLYVRPPSECPTCRAAIEQVVELAEIIPIGSISTVK